MAVQLHDRVRIAVRQLETAIEIYFSGMDADLYSVITLAGAADTLLGQALRMRGEISELDRIKASAAEISSFVGSRMYGKHVVERANLARNALKHWDADQPTEIAFDAQREASDLVNRAVINYWFLQGTLTATMARFVESRSENDGSDNIN